MEVCFGESHALAGKHNVVTIEKTIGTIKKYFQLKTAMAAKQRANAHAVPRMSAKDSGGRRPSCYPEILFGMKRTLRMRLRMSESAKLVRNDSKLLTA
jgi:hypothetical protein